MRVYKTIFGIALAGVVFSFGMSIYTAIQLKHEKAEASKVVIPLPAGSQ